MKSLVCVAKSAKLKDKQVVPTLLVSKNTTEIDSACKRKKKRERILKPKRIQDYNARKTGIDLCDMYFSYSSAVRKSVKWYQKLPLVLLSGTSVLNAPTIYILLLQKRTNPSLYYKFLVKSWASRGRERKGTRMQWWQILVRLHCAHIVWNSHL